MKISNIIERELNDGYQVQSVWIVPPTAPSSSTGKTWELHIKRADWVPLGEGCSPVQVEFSGDLPEGVKMIAREKLGDAISELSAMSDEQAEAIARELGRAGDATAVRKTSSGCWAVGPCAAWVRDPLRTAILGSRNRPGRPPASVAVKTADSIVKLRIPRSEKGAWVKQAQAKGLSLSEWIRSRCNG